MSYASYESRALGPAFGIQYPEDWRVIEGTQAQDVNHYVGTPVVKLATPEGFLLGTNFNEASVTVSQSSAAADVATCLTKVDSWPTPLVSQPASNGFSWMVANFTGAAAGNRYDEIAYRLVRDNTCVELLTTIHSGNIGNYEPGVVTGFDQTLVADLLEQAVQSFEFLLP